MSAYVSAALRRQIRDQFANCCAYCLTTESLSVVIFEIDHIIPRSGGGETELQNLCLACPTCNRYKADRQQVVSGPGGQTATLFHPQSQLWSDHFIWSENATEIIALTPTGQVTIDTFRMNRLELMRLRRLWVRRVSIHLSLNRAYCLERKT